MSEGEHMVLTIDIGNTNIVIGGFDGDRLSFVARIATNANKTEDEYATKIRSVLKLHQVEEINHVRTMRT